VLLSQQGAQPPAILALADGTVFLGSSIGAAGSTSGEVVFNTAITGYQEILTDPSYCRQIVTLTYPHIGNYGVNEEDVEAGKVHAAGLIIRDLPLVASNFRSHLTLSQYLQRENTVGIADIDTRKLTRLLRTNGAQNGCILACNPGQEVTPGPGRPGRRRGAQGAGHERPGPRQGGVRRPTTAGTRPSGTWAAATATWASRSTTSSPSTTA
jgi:carbamoyl-phosphate synthase small subunit